MNKETLRQLAEENGLQKDDFFMIKFGQKQIPIIVRAGIEKIQTNHDIEVTYDIVYHTQDLKTCLIKAVGTKRLPDGKIKTVETFGEVSPSNCKQTYPVAIAEKRALSRVVLKLAGLYEQGVMGEVESEDFKQKPKKDETV